MIRLMGLVPLDRGGQKIKLPMLVNVFSKSKIDGL